MSKKQDTKELDRLPLFALKADWKEGVGELSFPDVEALVSKALQEAWGVKEPYDCPYWVYKLWPDKAVVKRAYGQTEGSLFKMYPYEIKEEKEGEGGYKAVLGESKDMYQMFVPVGSEPADALLAVREADTFSADDPNLLDNIFDEEGDEDEEDEEKGEKDKEDEVTEARLQEAEIALREKGLFDDDHFDCPLTEAKVDIITEGKSKKYIIRNVAMLSEYSRNGRRYRSTVQKEALHIFEGIKAYADHPTKANENEPRRVKELIGRYKDVYYDEGKVKTFGDLHLAPTELVTGYIVPMAEADPSLVGSSVNIYGRMDSKGNVEKITKGRSVDIVTEPATTSSLYEAVDTRKEKENETKNKGDEIMTIKKEDVLNDEGLMEELRQHIMEELEVVNSVEAKDTKIKEQEDRIKTLEEDNTQLKLAEKTRLIEAEIDTLLTGSKLPEDAKKEVRPLMQKAASEDERKQILTRMETIVESARKTANKVAPSVIVEGDDKNQQPKLSDADLRKKILASFTSRAR